MKLEEFFVACVEVVEYPSLNVPPPKIGIFAEIATLDMLLFENELLTELVVPTKALF